MYHHKDCSVFPFAKEETETQSQVEETGQHLWVYGLCLASGLVIRPEVTQGASPFPLLLNQG